MNSKLVDYIKDCIKESNIKSRHDAAMGGYNHDGGANASERDFRFWSLGIAKTIPREYESMEKEFNRLDKEKNDPEYQEFLRLKEKFKIWETK